MPSYSPLEPVRRIVTSHNSQAKAIVTRDSLISAEVLPHGSATSLLWSSDQSPATNLTSDEDQGKSKTGLTNNGSILRVVDFPPHSSGKLHRSISLDYVIVQKGTVLLTLDDGSRTAVSEGSVVIQRATMHGWDNDTDEWVRIICILMPAEAPVVNGVELQAEVPFTVK
jgi:quercetin dioxygenase-like cupin family protein